MVLTPKSLRSAYLNKGPGEGVEVFTNAALRKCLFSLSANRLPSPAAPKSAVGSCSHPNTKEEQPIAPLHYPRPLLTRHRWQAALTSTCVHLQLSVDVGLVYKGVKDIEDTVNIPDFGIGTKEVDLLL